jgi:hypothetical protein
VKNHLVAGRFERFIRKLVWFALNFLHREHVDVVSYQPVDHAPNSGSNTVYVPGGYAHAFKPNSDVFDTPFHLRANRKEV